ncbi:hypothetical protein [Levilactobacillus brevis]|uniref:hypothetical protein n=2 Tax=Levilactobacillus brevis TaxID=1580 RepID=UPI0031D8942A
MIINGTMSNIKVKRTRNYFRNATVEINCPDYRLSGEFSPYKRLADFLWENLAQKVIPEVLKGTEEKHDHFLSSGQLSPATLTVIGSDESESRYLLTCMDSQLTTTYHVFFTMNEEIFRRSHYKVAINHVKVEVKEKTVTREYRPDGISEEGFDAYTDLAGAVSSAIADCVSLAFEGTDEEYDSMFYVIPKWVDKSTLIVYLEKDNEMSRWICKFPDGEFYATATFDLKIF